MVCAKLFCIKRGCRFLLLVLILLAALGWATGTSQGALDTQNGERTILPRRTLLPASRTWWAITFSQRSAKLGQKPFLLMKSIPYSRTLMRFSRPGSTSA